VIVTPSRAYAPAAVPASLQSFCTVRPLSTGHHELQGFVEFHSEPMGKGGRELHKSFFATRTFRSCSRASTCRASAIGDRDGPDGAGDPPRSDTLTAGGPKLGSHGQATLVRDVVAKANERPRLAGRQRPPPTHLGRSASPAGSATASTGFRLCAPAQLFLAQIEESNRRPACKRVSPVRPRRCRTSSLPPGPRVLLRQGPGAH